jgi:LPXTG-site transpeptidase (sortase) family protein
MIQSEIAAPVAQPAAPRRLSRRARILWTLGNFLLLAGAILLLYVGGLYSSAEYGRFAARGDNDEPAPAAVAAISPAPQAPNSEQPAAQAEPAPFVPAILNTASLADDGRVTGAIPDAASATHESTVSRISIPAIEIDSKVVPVGWDVVKQKGGDVAVWQVAEYAVGHHKGSANPGEHGNIVLAGHVGGYGKIFKDLIKLQPGDQITLYSNGQQYLYVVREQVVVTEEGVSPEVQLQNAQYIAPTDSEMITMVTCWPPTGKNRFTQRVIVRATPYSSQTDTAPNSMSNWSLR